MSLRESLERWHRAAPTLLQSKPLREPKLKRTAEDMARRWSGVANPPPMESIDELAGRLRAALAADDPDQVSDRDWTRAAFALWQGETPLAADAGFLDFYLARLEYYLAGPDWRRRRRDVALLISAYLRAFAPDLPGIRRVAEILTRFIPLWEWPWAARQRELRLFDPERGPAALAQACLADDEPARVLAKLGLRDLHGQGLVLTAQLLAVDNVEKALASGREPDARLERLLHWAVDAGGVAARLRGPLADALLRPWLSRPVPDQLKQRIQDFLLEHYGDMRTKPHRWMAASDDARRVFRKWLARVALVQFLEIIDRLALDRQWKYRRAFWTAYFDRDWVWDAQVAFGSAGAVLARQLFGRDAPFSELERGGGTKIVEPGHAVLLMRLGTLTIADWSHNGQCAIWREGNRNAPSLLKGSYASNDVDWSLADQSWVHGGAANYTWQNRVREFIAEETGLALHQREFWIG
jgi:EH_Signature domain